MTREDNNPKWVINYDVLIDIGVFKSSTEQSEKIKTSANMYIMLPSCGKIVPIHIQLPRD